MKWSEGRVSLFGHQSAAGKRRAANALAKAERSSLDEKKRTSDDVSDEKARLGRSGSASGSDELKGGETMAPTLLK